MKAGKTKKKKKKIVCIRGFFWRWFVDMFSGDVPSTKLARSTSTQHSSPVTQLNPDHLQITT
jgi:hypothetical protein